MLCNIQLNKDEALIDSVSVDGQLIINFIQPLIAIMLDHGW